ncbi:uncharacterized protein LOC143234097 isoform X1 [Tachypleus tridentatus]|uniref:uncharacterized protein LOC143234097 isoform X1 n=1 Tax=Tachypleus tridentatus TaxID=6853 RepID=UPI003FCF3F72
MGKNQNRSPIQSFPTSTSERNAYAISTSIQHPSLSIRNPEELYRDGVDNPSYYNSEIELTISSYIHTSSLKHFDDHNIPAYATLKKCTFLKFWKLFFALFIVLVILMFGIAMTIYITDGTFYTSSDIEKDGFWAVKGEFRVINRVYNKVMNNHKSEAFVSLAAEVIKSVDELFIMSSLVRDYNSTEILGFRNGSVVVVCKILLNRPFSRAAELVGLTFAQSLKKGHGILPTKSLHVDITSIRFVGLPGVTTLSTDLNLITSPLRDAAWTPWSQWTSCNDLLGRCDSKQMHSRSRDCRTNFGRGSKLLSNALCKRKGGYETEILDCECFPSVQLLIVNSLKGSSSVENVYPSVNATGSASKTEDIEMVNETTSGLSICPGYQYTCTNGQCISRDYFCDRYYDCEDHSDEPERCRVPCLINHKQCQNSRCVKRTAWCDGIDTCGDNSDESYCPLVSETKL